MKEEILEKVEDKLQKRNCHFVESYKDNVKNGEYDDDGIIHILRDYRRFAFFTDTDYSEKDVERFAKIVDKVIKEVEEIKDKDKERTKKCKEMCKILNEAQGINGIEVEE